MLFSTKAFADAGHMPVIPVKKSGCPVKPAITAVAPSVSQADVDITQKIFSLGRGVGASYYHLIDLCDKSENKSFKELQQEYNDTFQSFNIVDIILADLNINGKSRRTLNKIRIEFYNALRNQDLSETKLSFVRDMFIVFYEDLSQDINSIYSCKGDWLLSLGFYTSFQLESINSTREEKLLLSGFEKIMSKRPVIVPNDVYANLAAIYRLDKPYITQTDLIYLKKNLETVTEYFTNYPEFKPLFNEKKDLIGIWQGILFNPDGKKYDIRLTVNNDLTASMDIDKIAHDVMISDIRLVNNYFTFMFKPFGTEKLYMRFNAKLSDNIFTGEIVDVAGERGYWVLAKTDKDFKLSDAKLNTMVSYINRIQEKMDLTAPASQAKMSSSAPDSQAEMSDAAPASPAKNTAVLSIKETKNDIIPVKNEVSQKPAEDRNIKAKKSITEKLKNLFWRFFSFFRIIRPNN